MKKEQDYMELIKMTFQGKSMGNYLSHILLVKEKNTSLSIFGQFENIMTFNYSVRVLFCFKIGS